MLPWGAIGGEDRADGRRLEVSVQPRLSRYWWEICQAKLPLAEKSYARDLVRSYFGKARVETVLLVPHLMLHLKAIKAAVKKLPALLPLPRSRKPLRPGPVVMGDLSTILATLSMAAKLHRELSCIFFGYSLLTEEPLSRMDLQQIAGALASLLVRLPTDGQFAEERSVGHQLLCYIATHEQDPGNVLVGRRASPSVAPEDWAEQDGLFCEPLPTSLPWLCTREAVASGMTRSPSSDAVPFMGQLPLPLSHTLCGDTATPVQPFFTLRRGFSPKQPAKSLGESAEQHEWGPVSPRESGEIAALVREWAAEKDDARLALLVRDYALRMRGCEVQNNGRFGLRKNFARKVPSSNKASDAENTSSPGGESCRFDVGTLVRQWASEKEEAVVARLVRDYASNMRCYEMLTATETGDLVVVCLRRAGAGQEPAAEPAVVRYARLVGFVDSKHVAVHLDPRERDAQWRVPMALVRVVPPEVVQVLDKHLATLPDAAGPGSGSGSGALSSGNTGDDGWAAALASLVHPSETSSMVDFCPVVSEYVTTMAAALGEAHGIDVMALSSKRDSVLSELHDVQLAIRLVSDERRNAAEKLSVAVRNYAESFFAKLNKRAIFLPERKRIIAVLHEGPTSSRRLFDDAIGELLNGLERGLRTIRAQIDSLESGERKRELSSWWLDLVRTRVMEELLLRGYKEHVTPDDYIRQPPLDLGGVVFNLQLLHTCLDEVSMAKRGEAAAGEEGHMVRVIEELKSEIYGKIDAYVADCLVVFSEALRMRSCDWQTATTLFDVCKMQFSERKRRALKQLMDDVSYLQEMRELESSCKRSMHVVPVSGLAVGRLVRLEHEMRTVCEVWGERIESNSESGRKLSLASQSGYGVSEDDDTDSVVALVSLLLE